MTRRIAFHLAVWSAAAAAIAAIAAGCSSTPPAEECAAGTTVACTCAGGQTGTQACGVAGCNCDDEEPDSGEAEDADTPGDATHRDEQPPPSVTYACAVQGGFGWPCSLDASGPDPAECTDPRFGVCFAGAQGARCTALCGDAGFAGCPVVEGVDAGCVPTDCNARGFCK